MSLRDVLFGRAPTPPTPTAAAMTLACSFCGKSQRDVRKLIAGPSVYICDDCIGLSVGILAEEAGQNMLAELVLGAVENREVMTRHADVQPALRAAIDLAAGDAVLLRRIYTAAQRFYDEDTAARALGAIPSAARTTSDDLNRAGAYLQAEADEHALVILRAIDETTLAPTLVLPHTLALLRAEIASGGTEDVQRERARRLVELAPAVAATPEGQRGWLEIDRLAALVRAYLALGEGSSALRIADEALALSPRSAGLHELRARALDRIGRGADADAARKTSLSLAHPDSAVARRLGQREAAYR